MINKRKTLALIILLAGVIISILIIIPNSAEDEKIKASSDEQEDNPAFGFNTSDNDNSKLALPEGSNNENFVDSESNENLTENLADSYTRSLVQEGMGGNLSLGEDAVVELEKNIPSGLSYPQFSEKDIKISSDASEKNQVIYIEAVDKAIWDNFGELKDENTNTAIREFFENDNPDVLNKFIEATSGYIDSLLQIEVPENMKEIHLGMLNVWRKKLTIYEAVINQVSDPVKSYLAIQDLPTVLQEDQALQMALIEKYEELTN